MTGFWNACPHGSTTPPDDMGDAVCLGCGAVVRRTLTLGGMLDAVDSVRRDFGRLGSHTKRCVETPDGWVCATGCDLARR